MAGFAKPDVQFFEHTARMAKPFRKSEAIIIGDRLEADIVGAMMFGIESCWFNPEQKVNTSFVMPTYEVSSLRDVPDVLAMHGTACR